MENLERIKEMFEGVCEIGCCKRCSLRYIGETERLPFINIENTLISKGIATFEHFNVKIQKQNPCIACLGLLQKEVIENSLIKIQEEIIKEGYDSKTFNVTMTLPVSFQIRAHSIWLFIKNKFPDLVKCVFPHGLVTVSVKDVWKWLIVPKIEETISKYYDCSSNFVIMVGFHYIGDESEAVKLSAMGYIPAKAPRSQRKLNMYSRKNVDLFLRNIDERNFSIHFGIPPSIPSEVVNVISIQLNHNSIYFAGRYNKFSRNLPQTPWIIDGERRVQSSIHELITIPINELVKAHEVKFSASGREDVDVRTLGRGRPFAVEFINPKHTIFSFNELREVEKRINYEGQTKVAIRDLQLVQKECLKELKEGEEHKRKSYCAYCIVSSPTLPAELDNLEGLTPLTIQQKTPIRVLHRRPYSVRPRVVYSMKTVPHVENDGPNGCSFFKLYIDTQAGTYIKEFIHGDFGRTQPNLNTLLGGVNVDILALDVQNISLDWPPAITYPDNGNAKQDGNIPNSLDKMLS